MSIKKGFIKDMQPELLEANYDYVWLVAMEGKDRIPGIVDKLREIPEYKRGIVHRPSLTATINENGSFMLELLQEMHISSVNKGAPILIDMFIGNKYALWNNLESVRQYVSYISDHWAGLTVKPLLRLNTATWNKYINTFYPIAIGMLDTVDILAVQPDVSTPYALGAVETLKWWEYTEGIIAYDETGEWLDSPIVVNPPVVDDVPFFSDTIQAGSLFPMNSKITISGSILSKAYNDVIITVEPLEKSE
jgi:hypothetical protein